MKVILSFVLLISVMMYPSGTKAFSMPCSMVLEPLDKTIPNMKGAALIYTVDMLGSPRTNISVLAAHLPKPSYFGNYDRYEGFAFVPEVISWRFLLSATTENDGETRAGKFDLITGDLDGAHVQVRPSNSRTEKLGPPVLTNQVLNCK